MTVVKYLNVVRILNVSLARVEWFMRKIEGWKRSGSLKQG